MSNHKDSLVKVLEYLVNEEREKASDLLHDVFVEKAKNHWASLTESDESVEEDIQEDDLDETYDVDEDSVEEGIDSYDAEEDFLSDIESAEDEIDSEEIYDDEDMGDDEAAMDLAVSMDDGEGEIEADEAPEAEEALANVEDAIEELRAAFADLMGDEAEEGDDEGEEAMEPEMEPEMEEEVAYEAVEEGAELKAVNVSMPNGEDGGAKSPVGPGDKSLGEGNPVDIAGSEEKGGTAPAAKDMGVTGPQEAGDPKPAPAPKREMK
jgi:hypothetical protein